MEYKKFIIKLGFKPKENTSGIFQKKYNDDYSIEINFDKQEFNFGKLIKTESKTTQNFSQKENWVVLECVNRLLDKGYQPQNITLEKTWKTGHGTSGRLDILITRKNEDTAYLMIECKTWGAEFDKEFKRLQKDGGQLFTYFQQDKNADVLMLYASEFDGEEVKYRNVIIKVEEDYKQTGNVKDFYDRWNKLPKSNGIFDSWVNPYEFQSKALTKKDLKELKQEDSSFIFNRFLEILRHNVVSDKPNAFNKIFTLFLCKIVDEDRKDDEQLHFQWLEGEDDNISFQKRLTDLYTKGMQVLLDKEVTDVSDDELDRRFQQVDEKYQEEFKKILTEIRLKKNNEFAIKEVYDDESFTENAKVVKEVVELLQVYKLRYNYRQQFLSDFFELLLTTGLKQESGQFFTPVPIARFIIKSIPLQKITENKIRQGNRNDLLPTIIDYASGSGHFITESMEEIQKIVEALDENKYSPSTKRFIRSSKDNQFDWAFNYVYAIEKDYRLVKTTKVSCYLHGDGLAKIIHGDGLGDFETSKEFKNLLCNKDKTYPQDNKQFDIVISNPPYSVSAFKGSLMEEAKAKKAFELYPRLTDQSSEIECLFIERTKQLLKDDGVAGIILPSSILSNAGIYTQTREIILKYFDIIAITELGSSTFMATGTNTVTLFLRRRNNADSVNIKATVNKFFDNKQDNTNNGIEKPVEKYLAHVWEDISIKDYITLINKEPNEKIQKHEIFEEYKKKIKTKNEKEQWNSIIELEKEKLFYFVLTYPQKIVLIKTGQKKVEKQFLGYEFSNRRGSEGIHPIQRGKTIDECTQLYDANSPDNTEKASAYIYKAFAENKFDLDIPEHLQKNISYQNLVDMLTFDRVDFEKNISLSAKKKVKIESKWDDSKVSEIISVLESGKRPKGGVSEYQNGIPSLGGEHIGLNGRIKINDNNIKFVPVSYYNDSKQGKVNNFDILICKDGALTGKVALFNKTEINYDKIIINEHVFLLRTNNLCSQKYLFNIFYSTNGQELLKSNITGQAQGGLNRNNLLNIKIPLPPKEIQEKIVSEIEVLEKEEKKAFEEVEKLKKDISNALVDNSKYERKKLGEICKMKAGDFVSAGDIYDKDSPELYPCYGGNGLRGYTKSFTHNGTFSLIGRQGALCGNVHKITGKFHATEHAVVTSPTELTITDWLYYHLISMNLNQYATGTAQPGLSVNKIKEIETFIPTIEEQKKIVSEIEKIETKINKLEKLINEIPKKKEEILKKYL